MAHTCTECGGHEKNNWAKSHRDKLQSTVLCFSCDFWLGYAARVRNPSMVRVNGIHYVIGDEHLAKPGDTKWSPFMHRKEMRGHGGRKFVIHFHDGRIVETTNLWCQGDIPAQFRDRLPDNATFLNSDERGKATQKAKPITELLESISGVSRDEAVCSSCKRGVSMDSFRNEISRREFRISRLCQYCQDSVFGSNDAYYDE